MSRLAQLAMNPSSSVSREEIYLAVASLYRIQGTGLNERERVLMRDILRRLTRNVEMAIRISLAQRLADDTDAPHDLILMLVDDAIAVARPLILKSPLLLEEDLLDLIARADTAHHEAIAGRPGIGERVTDALVAAGCEPVLMTLVRNETARISQAGYAALVEKSRLLAGLQEPLTHRPDLPPALAAVMCGFVSEALKAHIQAHYPIPVAGLDRAVQEAVQSLAEPAPAPREQPQSSAQKLIEKLAISGQLKASFLIRVLNQGQADLFDLAFSRLLDMDLLRFRNLFYSGGPRQVAIACRAVGIDRSAFPTVYNLSRQTHGRAAILTPTDRDETDTIFATFTRQFALQTVRNRSHH